MRKDFCLSDEQCDFILKVCDLMEGEEECDRQDPESKLSKRVNAAWDLLGSQLGFNGRTCEEIPGKGGQHFSAEVAGVEE